MGRVPPHRGGEPRSGGGGLTPSPRFHRGAPQRGAIPHSYSFFLTHFFCHSDPVVLRGEESFSSHSG
ncbi:hypothetical protein II582_02635 [bacterium]|nr:hypothetical protein [bacterium]